MRFFLLVATFFLSAWQLYGQTGPAGIGTGDGSVGPRNVLWLKADAGVTETANRVSAWADQSGNSLNAVQANSTLQPLYSGGNANLNNMPSISFGPSGTTNFHLAIPDSPLLDGSTEMNFFVVIETAGTGTQGILNKRTSAGVDQSYRLYRDGGNIIGDISNGSTASVAVSNNTSYLLSTSYNHALTGNKYFLYRNSVTSSGANVATSLPDNASSFFIGNFNLGDNRSFPGAIAEIIVYNDALTDPQRIIVENLLATKYGLDLTTHRIFGSLGTYDAAFFNDYRGIGTVDGTVKEVQATSDALAIAELNNTLNSGEFVALAHDGTPHADGITTEIAAEVDARWARSWYLEVSQSGTVDGGSVNAELVFDFGDAGLTYSGVLSDYVLLYRNDIGNDFDRVYADSYTLDEGDKLTVSVPGSRLKSGYYTLGEGVQLVSKTWYVFQDGNWADATTWTLDASTAPIFNNPANDVPGPDDDVIIRSGRAVTIQGTTNNLVVNSVDVRGTLYLTTSTGHNFNTINGAGQIRLQGSGGNENFPLGSTSGNIGFADPDNGGTLIIGGAGDITLGSSRAFRHLIVEKTANTDNVILAADYTLYGDLTVRNGNLQFGDGSAVARTLTVAGSVLVEDNTTTRIGSISTANANITHAFHITGDFTNNGKVYFTNRLDFASTADRYNPANTYYTSDDATGRVNIFFVGDTQDQTVNCNDLTYFSRIVVDKGTDEAYSLSIQAPDSAYFRLFGRANYDINSNVTAATSNLNAFSLIKGTARLGTNVIVPVLNTTGNYSIPSTARLQIDGGYVRKSSGTAVVPYGTVEVTSGQFVASVGSGVTIRDAGKFKIDGGSARMAAFRTSVDGASAQGTYEQNGGDVTITGGAAASQDYALFSLTYTGNVYVMTGGTLTINGRNNTGTANARGALFINCDPGNQLVTGGTVVFESNTTTEYRITSRSPFYNVRMRAANGTAANIVLVGTTSGSGGGADEPTLTAQPLVVLNDLVINGYSDTFHNNPLGDFPIVFAPVTSAANVNDVYIGGSFYVGRNSTYLPVFGGLAPYDALADLPTDYNTTYFTQTIGTSATDTIYNGVTGGAGVLEMGSLVLDRATDNELRLVARNGDNGGTRLDVNGNIAVLSGIVDQNAYTLRIWGSITNNGRLGTYFSSGPYPTTSGTPSTAQIRFREDPPVTISTSDGAVFGNLRFNVGSATTVEFDSDVYVERMEYWNGRIYIKNHTLTIDEVWNINNGGGAYFNSDVANTSILRVNNTGITGNILVFSDGKASDGGLRLKVNANTLDEDETSRLNNAGPITFPVGFTLDGGATFISRPAQLKVKDFADDGYVKINVVSGELQLTDLAGGEMLQHYWRVQHDEFTTLPTVALRFYYRAYSPVVAGADRPDIEPAGQEENYVPGYVLDDSPYTRHIEPGTGDIIPSSYQSGGINNGTRLVVFNGASSGAEFGQAGFSGFTLTNGNFSVGEAARFVGSPAVYYTKGRDFTATQPRWETANTWTRSDQPGFDSSNPHISSNPDSPDTPGPGDIAVIGFFPFDDPKTAYRGYPHSARIETGNLEAARLIFTQMTDEFGAAPVVRKYLTEVGGINIFQFRPTLTWSSVGIIDAKTIEGEGTIRIRGFGVDERKDPSFANIDIGDFASQDSSYLLYEGYETYTISNIPDQLPNLMISTDGWGVNDRELTIAQDFTTRQNLEIQGNSNLILGNGAGGNATINGNLYLVPLATNVGGGELRLQSTGTARTLTVAGNIHVGNPSGPAATGGSVIRVASGGLVNHTLAVAGNILVNTTGSNTTIAPNGNGLIFGGATESNIHLTLNGSTDGALNVINGDTPQLFRIRLDKSDNQSARFSLNNNITLSGSTNTSNKALEIVNGVLVLNHSAIDLTLSSGGGDFLIPNTLNTNASSGSGGLEIAQGTARVSGANTGIKLDGLLRISGGTLDMDGGAGVNNFIEYSASGNAEIELTSGALTVGSQVRRSTTSTSGILKYSQTGGIATFGKNAAPVTTRGVFEVLNSGSAFTLDIDGGAGESFTIVRHVNSTTVPTLRLSPTANSISDGSAITVGNGDTPASQLNFGIYSEIALKTIEIASPNIAAKIYAVPLTVDNLNIAAGTFNANGFNLTINESLTNDGTFISGGTAANGQTTYFPTSTNGLIAGSGTADFWNFNKGGSGTLTLGSSVTVNNNTAILAGTLDTDTYAFNIKKDLVHDATHVSDATGPGVVFNGTTKQTLGRSGTGTSYFGVVNINNAAGVLIADSEENFQVENKLVLTSGVFDIGGNLLIIPVNATIENASGGSSNTDFNVNRMIQTNSSIKDFGVRKLFPATAGGNITFTFPVGLTSYTPAVINITDISASAVTLRPVADLPPIAEDTEFTFTGVSGCEDPDITDASNVLSYYWIIKSDGVANLNGSLEMYYAGTEVHVTAPYSIANYGPARLYNEGSVWDKVFTTADFDEAGSRIVYPLVANSDATLEGIYTAGVTLQNDGTSLLCGGAIPDQVPQFITLETSSSGSYYDDAAYADGVAPSPGSSSDIVVKDGFTLILDASSIRLRKITIEVGGILEIGSGTSNHNLGFVTGEGTLKLNSNGSSISFPTGDYESFFPNAECDGGGGIEYAGSGSYTVLSDLPNVRRLVFSGSGTRTLPNNHALQVCSDLEIMESVDLIIPDGNNNIIVAGNIYKADASSFDNGGGTSKVTLQGTSQQVIAGDFTGDNSFNGLEINNPGGVTIVNAADPARGIAANGDVNIEGQLTFTLGAIGTNSDNQLRLALNGAITGFNSTRYINGPFVRELPPNTQAYVFPVGKGTRNGQMEIGSPAGYVGTKDWTVEYFSASAGAIGPVDNVDAGDEIVKVSGNEYWYVDVASPANSNVTLYWDNQSNVASTISNLRLAYWTGATWDQLSTTMAPQGTPASGSIAAGPLSYSTQHITFATIDEDETPLPVEFIYFEGKAENGQIRLEWATASETNNDFFEVQRSPEGTAFETIGIVQGHGTTAEIHSYSFTDHNPFWGTSYYRLQQTDFDGNHKFSEIVNVKTSGELFSLNIYPNPIEETLQIVLAGSHSQSAVAVYLLDITGNMILTAGGITNTRGGYRTTMEIPRNLPAGFYVLVVENQEGIHRQTLIRK